ncbi:MAG: winged helix-turn-helix domain-containing protein [Kiloniellales bacterium]
MTDEPIVDPPTPVESLYVAGWHVDVSTHRISKAGKTIKLEPRTMAVLVYLARRPGEAVSREELEREVWRGMVVGYDALSNTIAKLRKAFGDDRKQPRVIETISKVGYRLIGEVGLPPASPVEAYPAGDQRLERKLAAIFYADVVGYSRLSGEDEEGTHRILRAYLDVITTSIETYGGSVVNFAGDAVLADFPTVSDALACAVAVQKDLEGRTESVPEERKLRFRIGVNLGEIIVDRDDIYGDGVNVAARLESLAEPGGVCVSGAVFDTIGQKLPLDYRFLGEQTVKNIAKPVRAYHARLRAGAALPSPAPAAAGRKAPRGRLAAIAAAVALLVAAGAALTLLKPWQPKQEPASAGLEAIAPPDTPSIAVLPFANLSDDPEQEYFADGMTDDLITDLSKLGGLFVISRHSVFTYKDRPVKPRQVAEELGVRYLVEGSIRRAGGQIRVNAQLIDAASGGHLWAERYDGDETDLFTLQDRVIADIVSALAVELTDTEKTRLSRRPTDNLEAYDYYLRAERSRLYGFGGERHSETITLYEVATALDSEFAEAYAGLAETAFHVWRWDITEVLPNPAAKKLAYESAGKVLSLDPENPRAYAVLAMLQVTDGQHDLALESAHKAVSLDPNSAVAFVDLAEVLVWAGQHAEALEAMETAFRLNPKPPAYFHGDLGIVLFFNRRYDEAIDHLRKAIEAGADYREELAMTYGALGRLDEAKAEMESLYEIFPFANLAYFRVFYSHHKREEDLEHRIEAFRKAGVPDWPYGYQPILADRLDRESLEALTFGHTWTGHDSTGARFVQEFNADGRVAFRGRTSLLIGTARLKDNMICVKFPAALLDREDCGYVYRTPRDASEGATEFVRVALGDIYYFSVTP